MAANKKESAEEDLQEPSPLDQLISAVTAQKATFNCGGNVQILNNKDDPVSRFENLTYDVSKATSAPSVLRWDISDGDNIRKMILPLPVDAEVETTIAGLVKHCSPATFGKVGEEVLDESYRKAAKLDAVRFSTNCNSYDVGIVDAIAQTFLPGVDEVFADGKSIFEDHLGVVAELYKLNVSSHALLDGMSHSIGWILAKA